MFEGRFVKGVKKFKTLLLNFLPEDKETTGSNGMPLKNVGFYSRLRSVRESKQDTKKDLVREMK